MSGNGVMRGPTASDERVRLLRLLPVLAGITALIAACGGGGSGEAGATPVRTQIVVSGAVTFDLVPVAHAAGPLQSTTRLDYSGTTPQPARGVTVQAVTGSTVLATTTTDAAGRYSLAVDPDTPSLRLHARAEMLQAGPPGWDFRVVDNTESNALYVLEGAEFATARADLTRDLHAASGWDGVSYAATRAAAPFAILDVVYDAVQFVRAAVPGTSFPPLVLHWSPANRPTRSDDGGIDPTSGEIGSSLFASQLGIFLLGAEDSDTDEYDRHVVAHEWAHYLEYALSRSDSIGGPHTRGDHLDPRTAFSEGFANAFSAMVSGNPVYSDVLGPKQAGGFSFNVEGPFWPQAPLHANPSPGWFSEESIQELLYDLYDDAEDIPEDGLALGFGPILEVLTTQMRDTTALTSVFPFIRALKEHLPEQASAIDLLVSVQDIEQIGDDFGSGETNGGTPADSSAGTSADVLPPLYKPIAVNGPSPVNVCSITAYHYAGDTGSINKLGSRAFLRFTVAAAGIHSLMATATEVPAGEIADPDMRLHRQGPIAESIAAPDQNVCTPETPAGCSERFSRQLNPGEYVLEVYEWTNTQAPDSDYPPIGRTCFDVEVTQP